MVASMNVSLPQSLKEYVKARVAEGHYSNPSDYVRALIREDKKKRAEEKLESLLLEGLGSGNLEELTPDEWMAIKKELGDRIVKRKGA